MTSTPTPPPAPTGQESADRIVWIDCEMTGLDLGADALVEVAVVVTDSELRVLGEGVDVIISPPAEALEQMNDFVRTMHTTSGLLDQLPAGTTLAGRPGARSSTTSATWVPDPGKAPLAGNSVGTDKAFLDRDMAELVGVPALPGHRRVVDQGARPPLVPARVLRVPAQERRAPRAGGHPGEHRRAALLPRGPAAGRSPGPDSAAAKKIAAEVVATSVKGALRP